VTLGVGAVLAAAALGLASALDSPTGSAPADPSQPIVAGPVVAPGQELTGGASGLPPLRLVLDHAPPGNIGELSIAQQIPRLQALVRRGGAPRRLVELGSAQQARGDGAAALSSYREALRRDPGNLAARLGIVMVDGATGSAGLSRAAAAFRTLAGQHPNSQIVLFNQGWVAAYRRDAPQARASWGRTAALGGATPLGQAARQLVTALAKAKNSP
jgi:cytochrome c-type biogenesis protein CcmH/NrfG